MRWKLLLAAAIAVIGFNFSQPAEAGGDARCCGGVVYVHHHVYFPPVFRHVYHLHRPDAQHLHVIHYAGPPYGACCAPRYAYARSGYFYAWRGLR
jgi:hypothetical protein